jgi:hypothetical protein
MLFVSLARGSAARERLAGARLSRYPSHLP